MKRGLVLVSLILLVMLLSFSLVSASWLSDLWGKVTGKAVKNVVKSCFDSDYGINLDLIGTAKIYVDGNKTESNSDYCFDKNRKIREYYCKDNKIKKVIFKCKGGCVNETCISPEIKGCVDSDGGADYYVKGTLYLKGNESGSFKKEDKCNNEYNLREGSCKGTGFFQNNPWWGYNLENYDCPYGCKNGVCINAMDGCDLINGTIKAKIIELQNLNKTVILKEGEKIYKNQYVVIPGHLFKIKRIYNATVGYSSDEVEITDVFSGLMYGAVLSGEGVGILPVEGVNYNLKYVDDKNVTDDEYITLDYPQTSGDAKMIFCFYGFNY